MQKETQEGKADSAASEDGSLRRYGLPGQQIEPTAGLWLTREQPICVPTLDEVTKIAERRRGGDPRTRIDPADFPASEGQLSAELEILLALQKARALSPYPTSVQPERQEPFALTPLSRFLQLRPVPFGTIFDTQRPQDEIGDVLNQHLRILTERRTIDEGQELARAFENETPGLFHRHALNWAFFNRIGISPPRQARVWMALDMAIYTALSAAWYYKWLHKRYSRLLRPEEYDGKDGRLTVLYDRPVTPQGKEKLDQPEKACPKPTPGTPRHPAWPSGHSTYSAAASHILEYFFSPVTLGFPEDPDGERSASMPDEELFRLFRPGSTDIGNPGWIAAELRRLANNVGEARLWAGVHWVSDHRAGQAIGRAAAEAVIAKLRGNCVPRVDERSCPEAQEDVPPTGGRIRGLFKSSCSDRIPPQENRGRSYITGRGES